MNFLPQLSACVQNVIYTLQNAKFIVKKMKKSAKNIQNHIDEMKNICYNMVKKTIFYIRATLGGVYYDD